MAGSLPSGLWVVGQVGCSARSIRQKMAAETKCVCKLSQPECTLAEHDTTLRLFLSFWVIVVAPRAISGLGLSLRISM